MAPTRASYAADRARRQYQLAEPGNRLVVRQLEKDWETVLAEAERLDHQYQRFSDSPDLAQPVIAVFIQRRDTLPAVPRTA